MRVKCATFIILLKLRIGRQKPSRLEINYDGTWHALLWLHKLFANFRIPLGVDENTNMT
jgi:hypothetical protein